MNIIVVGTTDGKHIGIKTETDLFSIVLKGKHFEITGRLHYGNGKWKLWNANYVIEIEEDTVNG
jgi:hypothetical protein